MLRGAGGISLKCLCACACLIESLLLLLFPKSNLFQRTCRENRKNPRKTQSRRIGERGKGKGVLRASLQVKTLLSEILYVQIFGLARYTIPTETHTYVRMYTLLHGQQFCLSADKSFACTRSSRTNTRTTPNENKTGNPTLTYSHAHPLTQSNT